MGASRQAKGAAAGKESVTEPFPCFWLNQRRKSWHGDLDGMTYAFNERVGGHRKLVPESRVIFYRSREKVLFGVARVSRVESRASPLGMTYVANLADYVSFRPEVPVANVKAIFSMLRAREGNRGVPQHSISQIPFAEYRAALEYARQHGFVGDLPDAVAPWSVRAR